MSERLWPARVLVVDDDDASRRLVEVALRGLDVEVVLCADPEEAIGLVRDLRPAVLVLDVMMPGLDGPMVAERVRAATEPGVAAPKIVLWSALDASQLTLRARACGADAVVLKIAGPAALVQQVGALLELWES